MRACENDREKECYAVINEQNDIYISKEKQNNKFVVLGVDSVMLRHTLIYCMYGKHCIAGGIFFTVIRS